MRLNKCKFASIALPATCFAKMPLRTQFAILALIRQTCDLQLFLSSFVAKAELLVDLVSFLLVSICLCTSPEAETPSSLRCCLILPDLLDKRTKDALRSDQINAETKTKAKEQQRGCVHGARLYSWFSPLEAGDELMHMVLLTSWWLWATGPWFVCWSSVVLVNVQRNSHHQGVPCADDGEICGSWRGGRWRIMAEEGRWRITRQRRTGGLGLVMETEKIVVTGKM